MTRAPLTPRHDTRGFSLLELVAGLVLIAVIATLAAYGGATVVERSQQRAAVATLTVAQAEGQRVATRRNLQPGDENLRQFPVSGTELATALTATGLQFGTEGSEGPDAVSVHVIDPSTAVFAVRAGGRCLLLVDHLDGRAGWASTSEACSASAHAGTVSTWSDDPYAPQDLDVEGE